MSIESPDYLGGWKLAIRDAEQKISEAKVRLAPQGCALVFPRTTGKRRTGEKLKRASRKAGKRLLGQPRDL